MFAIANPKDIIPEEWKEEPISWLHEETQTELDSYYENIIELNHLTLYLKYLNSVNDNKTVKDLIYDLKFTLSGKQTQFTNGLLTEEEYIKQCDDATNSIIIRIKDKLNEEQKRISE